MTNVYRHRGPLVFVPVRHAGKTIRHIAQAPHCLYTVEYLGVERGWTSTYQPDHTGRLHVLGQAETFIHAQMLAERHARGLS